jgi:ArsR family transcriptional regulator, arsenate/arsenite/antimonite-responsive transcriptional repressor
MVFFYMDSIVQKLKALGDSNRYRIIMMLMERPLCVCEMLEVLDIAGGTLSNHLKILQTAGLIDQRKDGRWIEYYIRDDDSRELITYITKHSVDNIQVLSDRNKVGVISRSVCSSRNKSRKN